MSFTFNGREYNVDGWIREAISLVELLAKNLKLLDPLPSDTDLTDADEKEIQSQINAMLILPPFAVLDFWSAFAAHHLGQLATSLRALSRTTQPRAFSTLIQVLSLLPDPKTEPYFRRFIQSPQYADLANIIADGFVQGIRWKRPSGPGQICCLIIHFLFWGNSTKGDDGKASIDADVRTKLARKLDALIGTPEFERLPEIQRVDIERLHGILKCIEGMPADYYLSSTRSYLEGQVDNCGRSSCDEEAELACSKCKTVRYCGKKCQTWHWKNGHKLRCFQVAY